MSLFAHSEPDSLGLGSPRASITVVGPEKNTKTKKFVGKQFHIKKFFTPSKEPKNYTTDVEMSSLGIPNFLQDAYLTGRPEPKIASLRDWQKDLCKNSDWKNGRSAVILVPTSGGKTVAADIAIAQLLENDPDAKAIYALPFVALANEKYGEYEKRFRGFSVRPFFQNVGGSDMRRGHIGICTFEKAHSIINAAITGGYSQQIKLVVIDEIHMIGEEGRGTVIEALIVKLLLMEHHPRIVALTATVNEHDAQRLANWINGFSFIWKSRPTYIKQFIKKNDGSLSQLNQNGISPPFTKLTSFSDDTDHIMPLIRTLLSKRPQSSVLIFVNSRRETQKLAKRISKHMFESESNLPNVQLPSQELKDKRMELIKKICQNSGFIDDVMIKCIKVGVCYHHAGLLLEDRSLIEEAARKKIISVLVATTTLSAGVNIHGVSRVIIHNVFRISKDGKKKALTPAQYIQMVGRAGRNGVPGEAYIIARTQSAMEIDTIIDLSKKSLPNFTSHLTDGEEADRFFLHCLSTKLLPPNGLKTYVSHCLKFDNKITPDIDGFCNSITSRLQMNELIDREMNSTQFGRAVAGSSLTIEEGLELNQLISELQEDLCINDEVHLLYLCVSQKSAEAVKPFPYNSPVWNEIFKQHKHVIILITNMSDAQIEHMQDLVYIYGGMGRVNPTIDAQLDRLLVAVILKDLINEIPLKDIASKYSLDLGTIQKLQMEAASYAGQINKFCEISGRAVLAGALNKFRQRLNFAARNELVPLLSLPSCTRDIARILTSKGIMSPNDIAPLSIEQFAILLVKDEEEKVTDTLKETAQRILSEAQSFAESISNLEDLEEMALNAPK